VDLETYFVAGRPNTAVTVLTVEDTSLVPTFRRLTGLEFRRTAPDQVTSRVRCTLTLRRGR
jgi:hypothetical protein